MTFAKLKLLALTMSEEEQQATLKQLCNDSRGAAVLKLFLDAKEVASDDAAQPSRAIHHGVLAHAAGSRFQMTELEGKLMAACTPEKAKRKTPPETSEEG